MQRNTVRALLGAVLALSLIGSACGSSPSGGSKGTITVGAQSFSENAILANIYGTALKDSGYTVKYRLNLGQRAVVAPALERGDIDLYPGYTASDLEFYNSKKGEAGSNAQANANRLNTYLQPKGLQALAVSPATDQNVFVVTKQTADQYHLTSLSGLSRVTGQLTMGGPQDCSGRPDCLGGLQSQYGAQFKEFKPLDLDGPLTRNALTHGDIQLALMFSTDGIIAGNNWVVLGDPRHIVSADQVVPVVRSKAINQDAQKVLDGVSAKLTTQQLTAMNKKTEVDKAESSEAAQGWLKDHGYQT
jgi:osmoprotectant transport system substrate-binding protein